jgi:hypothetical protein
MFASEHWYACGPPPAATQGWKLYVPLTPLNAAELTRLVVPMAAVAGLHVKYVRDIGTLRKLNAGMFGYPQIAKCLVVYMPVVDSAFICSLLEALAPFRDTCPAVPCARPFGDRLPLFYRYGAYRDRHLTLGEFQVYDDRASSTGAVPAGILDELAPFTRPVPPQPLVAEFLKRYPVLGAIRQQGKCGVFHALDIAAETFTEVALKVGYHRGQLQPDGTDGNSFLRREIMVYRLLADRGLAHLAPAMLDSLDTERTVVLVLAYVRGQSLLALRLAGSLTVAHLDRAWDMLTEFHSGGVLVGDAKLANVLLDHDGIIRFLDFEGAGPHHELLPPVRTFFLDTQRPGTAAHDRAHFLASVLFPYEAGRYSWSDRQVSLTHLAMEAPDDAITAWARDRLAKEPSQCG